MHATGLCMRMPVRPWPGKGRAQMSSGQNKSNKTRQTLPSLTSMFKGHQAMLQ